MSSKNDICVFSGFGSEGGTITAYTTVDGISVNTGCFSGSLEEFREDATKKHGDNVHGNICNLLIQVIELRWSEPRGEINAKQYIQP